jgi:hypothetical protein
LSEFTFQVAIRMTQLIALARMREPLPIVATVGGGGDSLRDGDFD